ncbi:hypothetical protein [Burkholderia cenocepacia]|uniref:hypothetical protein n=1 Tax=Burkholderia cenocepacia TaxID=95486 RepID=UPI002ABDC48D|nr:hypothetical protein [Burkholderia cenocepacia]
MKIFRSFVFQFGIGMILSFGVMSAMESRSWSGFLGAGAVALFFVVFASGRAALDAKKKSVNVAGLVVCASCLLVIVGLLLNGVERIYLVNGDSYPRFLARDAGALNYEGLDRLHKTQCQHEFMEVYQKSDFWVIRCGMMYLQGHTFVSSTNPYAELEGQKR